MCQRDYLGIICHLHCSFCLILTEQKKFITVVLENSEYKEPYPEVKLKYLAGYL